MEIDLLIAKAQRLSPTRESEDLKAQHDRIEGDRGLQVVDGEQQMIQAVHGHVAPKPVARAGPP
jgi:hypothetical protein